MEPDIKVCHYRRVFKYSLLVLSLTADPSLQRESKLLFKVSPRGLMFDVTDVGVGVIS